MSVARETTDAVSDSRVFVIVLTLVMVLSCSGVFCVVWCIVTEERGLFLREKSSKMYSTSAYFLSKIVIEIPLNTILSFIFGIVGYSMVGMNSDASVDPRQLQYSGGEVCALMIHSLTLCVHCCCMCSPPSVLIS
jgi:hypothetical protein